VPDFLPVSMQDILYRRQSDLREQQIRDVCDVSSGHVSLLIFVNTRPKPDEKSTMNQMK
jgi:allophanate hydrolase subunit 1